MTTRLQALLCATTLAAACGGGSGTSPTPTATGPVSVTFTGTTEITAGGVCSGNAVSHAFSSGEGTIEVTLARSTGDVRMAVQVCHPTARNHATECTVPPFARLAVGESARATLKGGRSQVLVVYPGTCGAPGAVPTAAIEYAATVVHPG